MTFSYQDVRRNLFKYSAPVLVLAGFATYAFILPQAHKGVIWDLVQLMTTTEPYKSLIGVGAGLMLFAGVAFLLTEVLKVHDRC